MQETSVILGPGFVFLSWSYFVELQKRLLRCYVKALERVLDVLPDCSVLRLVIITFESISKKFGLKFREMPQGQAGAKHKVLCHCVVVDGSRS